jgi:hypothetical protein
LPPSPLYRPSGKWRLNPNSPQASRWIWATCASSVCAVLT